MVAVDPVNRDLVRSRASPSRQKCASVAGVRPMPGRAVDVDVEMADSREDVERCRTEHRHVDVLRVEEDESHAMGQPGGLGGSTISLAGGSVPTGMKGVGPRRSFAL